MPYAFSRAGIIGAPLLIILVALASDFAVYLYIASAKKIGGRAEFTSLGEVPFGLPGSEFDF